MSQLAVVDRFERALHGRRKNQRPDLAKNDRLFVGGDEVDFADARTEVGVEDPQPPSFEVQARVTFAGSSDPQTSVPHTD